MAKFRKTEKGNTKIKILAIVMILAVILILLVVFPLPQGASGAPESTQAQSQPQQTQIQTPPPAGTDGTPGTQPPEETLQPTAQPQETQQSATQPPETQLIALEYPLLLEGGKLELKQLFQYEGINPDCGNEDGKNVAAIMLTNLSEDYLEEAGISLVLMDGTALDFQVNDLPAGETVMAFSIDNTSVEADAQCATAACEAQWAAGIVRLPENIAVSVDGVAITVTNNTGRDISELVIYCRCPLGEEYFGGIAYQYTINDLSANGSATVEAWDCILGMAEVVRIAVNQE